MIYGKFLKRLLDLLFSVTALILLLPIILIAVVILAISLRSNPFFIQPRAGREGKKIYIIKLRTMSNARDEDGNLLPDEKRLLPVGSFIRKTSIDELPQLINVINGDMSLVGPRPLLMQYLPLYTPEQYRRHLVKPGITGWAQVNGRNSISWDQKFEKDVWYVDNYSFAVDCRIIGLTIKKVFVADGISANNSATMPFFQGTKSL